MRPHSSLATHHRAIRVWLWIVAALIFAMVLVGGATRLTKSGLSIVEWEPVVGVLAPLSTAAWEAEFAKYKTIPQYQKLNRGMSLAEFKVIYWWEWTHRLLGRIIGLAFLLPFVWLLWKGWVEPSLQGRLWVIFGLGALQGLAGWWMVASGLADRVQVSQYRLAFHLTFACVIFAATLWSAQRLLPHQSSGSPTRLRMSALGLVVLMLCQIYLGALVAGLNAGLIYNTWPLIDGSLVPRASDLFFQEPWWRNFFENPLTVQFVHRTVAYLLWPAAVVHVIDFVRTGREGMAAAIALALGVTAQAALGVATLLYQAPIGLALLHQAMAIAVLAIAVVHAERLTENRDQPALRARMADPA